MVNTGDRPLDERDLDRLQNLSRRLGVGDLTRFATGERQPAPWLARAIADELGKPIDGR